MPSTVPIAAFLAAEDRGQDRRPPSLIEVRETQSGVRGQARRLLTTAAAVTVLPRHGQEHVVGDLGKMLWAETSLGQGMTRLKTIMAVVGGAVVGAGVWWRKHPSACPYGQRFWIEAPHPFITRDRLFEALGLRAGETVLEVGPGTGYYTLAVAEVLAPAGILHIVDLQPQMLDHTTRRAREAGIDNVVAREGDARRLPYDDTTFDAAYLVAVLGEIPDQDAALRELSRVLRPGGRIVVGELFGDPHMVTARALRSRAQAAGLRFERRVGPPFGYFAVLRHGVAGRSP
jgi:protein-L-isoaspartate O-methyltransferase